MTDSSSTGGSGIVAGWYTDPYDAQQLRWWDGTAWTAHVAPPAAPAPAAVETPVAETPVADAPVVETPVADAPVVETPVVDAPVVETPLTSPVTESAPIESQTFPSRRAMREALGEALVTQSIEPVDVPELEPAPIEPTPVEPAPTEPAPTEIAPEPVAAEPVAPEPVPAQPTAFVADPAYTPPAEFSDTPTFTDAPAVTPTPAFTPPAAYTPPPTEPEIIDVVPLDSAPTAVPDTAVAASPSVVPVGGSMNVWVWLIVISPLLAAGIVGYVLATFTISGSPLILGASLLAPYLFVILFAAGDRSRLLAAGHDRPASFGWAALTAPIYLVQRAGQLRKEGSSGNLVLLLWLVAFVLAVAGIAGYGLLTHTALLPGLPE